MAYMKKKELRLLLASKGLQGTKQIITECLELGREGKPGGLSVSDFSIRDIAEATVGSDESEGRAWVESLDPRRGVDVMESGSAVSTTAFSNLTHALLSSKIMESYNSEEFMFSQMFETVSTRFSGERIPGATLVGDQAKGINELEPYPSVGIGEDYIDTPQTSKSGLIVPVSKEAVFFDRTGLVLQHASQVGEYLGIKKEKACIDLFIGAVNNYKWRGTSYNTYQSSTPWVNVLTGAGNVLTDWASVDAAETLFDNMLEPNTGEPILLSAMQLIGPRSLKHTINRILTATEVRHATQSAAVQTLSANPLRDAGYTGVTSRLLYRRLIASGLTADQAKATWFLGEVAKAFAYMENWPITVVQAPTNSEAEFNQDIVARFKASERGVPAVKDPRYIVKVSGY